MPVSFTCPGCRAHLKIRDESTVGQSLDCPECHVSFVVAKSPTGEIIGQIPAPAKAASATITKVSTPSLTTPHAFTTQDGLVTSDGHRRSASTKTSTSQTRGTSAGNSQSHPSTREHGSHSAPSGPAQPSSSIEIQVSPPGQTASSLTSRSQIVVWLVAGLGIVGLIWIISSPGTKTPQGDSPALTKDRLQQKSDETEKPVATVATEPDETDDVLPETPDGRMQALGKIVRNQLKKDGHFPAGTVGGNALPVAHRWSWLAQLAAERDNPAGTRIDWGQRWSDPTADRFVRRPIPRFQNPQSETFTSDDKFPATHFVGVAGVGADAPTLPVEHPRAGIFGQDRQTKLTDIHDGVSNTMLLAGVENHLGSWADGTSSYRAFTREPYLHGPDGFGTGQPKSMYVLMADGSVREVSAETDPRIVRRMAAMNDGLPLDPKVPGEPGSRPDPKPAATPSAADQTAERPKPVETTPKPPLVAKTPASETPDKPEPKPTAGPDSKAPPITVDDPVTATPIDIRAALSRRILSFDQTKPAAAYQLILQIEELAGVRIDYDRKALGEAAARLDKPISLRMKNASLEDLLTEILDQIDLSRKDLSNRIQIIAPR